MRRLLACCLLLCLLMQGACGAQVGGQFEEDPTAPEMPGAPQPPATSPPGPAEAEPAAGEPSENAAFPPLTHDPAVETMAMAPYPAEGLVGWLKTEPLPGTLVRLRLRDSALLAVLDPELRWEVVALAPGAAPVVVPAMLEESQGEPGWPLYTIDAAYLPSRSGPDTGSNYWPLLVQDNRLPLAKLKLVAARPESGTPFPKAVDIVRLAEDGGVLRSLASGVVSPEGVPGAEPNWFVLQPESAPESWAVEVHENLGSGDADTPMLHLTKVDAYAAEVFIRVALPQAAELRLRVYPLDPAAEPSNPTPEELALAEADTPELYGELRSLTPFTPELETQPADAGRLKLPDLAGLPKLPAMPGWLPALVLGVAGVLLLLLGIRLMQPPRGR